LIRSLNQLQRGLPFLPSQGAQGEQAEGIGAGQELVTAQSVAQGDVRLAGVELENATAAVILVGRARGAKQSQVAAAAAAHVRPLLKSAAGRATNLIE
ncbi:MAG: hypothetical protein WB773_08600, partial [Isosphaeraceae bacterium]